MCGRTPPLPSDYFFLLPFFLLSWLKSPISFLFWRSKVEKFIYIYLIIFFSLLAKSVCRAIVCYSLRWETETSSSLQRCDWEQIISHHNCNSYTVCSNAPHCPRRIQHRIAPNFYCEASTILLPHIEADCCPSLRFGWVSQILAHEFKCKRKLPELMESEEKRRKIQHTRCHEQKKKYYERRYQRMLPAPFSLKQQQ